MEDFTIPDEFFETEFDGIFEDSIADESSSSAIASSSTALTAVGAQATQPRTQQTQTVKQESRSDIYKLGLFTTQISSATEKTIRCVTCSKTWVVPITNLSTGNQWKHLRNIHKQKVPGGENQGPGPLEKFLTNKPTAFTAQRFRDHLVKWIISTNQPFTSVENPAFQQMIELCNPAAVIPSADTIKNDLMRDFDEERAKIRDLLQDVPGCISFALDCWTSPNSISFLAITAHFLDKDWNLQEILIEFVELSGSHSGENICSAFIKSCREMGILKKIIAVTSDNATNNDTFLRALETTCRSEGISFHGQRNHVRCIAHVMNLVVGDILGAMKIGAAQDEDELLEESEKSLSVTEEISSKLRRFVVKIRASPQRRERFARQCEVANLKAKNLILDVKTRWNSTFDMFQRAMELKEAIDLTLAGDRDLRKYELSEEDWEKIAEIIAVLQIFSKATKYVSTAKIPVLAISVPIYDWLMDKLEEFQISDKASPDMKNAIDIGMKKIMSYYKRTDECSLYAIATILDPRMKLAYYKEHKWDKRWIEVVHKLIVTTYNDSYGPSQAEDNSQPITEEEEDNDDLSVHLYKRRRVERKNELEEYLKANVSRHDTNLLQWWKLHEEEYPNLAKMAHDYMAIPATSVPVERVFSGAANLVSAKRNSLSADTIRACMCLKNWWSRKN